MNEINISSSRMEFHFYLWMLLQCLFIDIIVESPNIPTMVISNEICIGGLWVGSWGGRLYPKLNYKLGHLKKEMVFSSYLFSAFQKLWKHSMAFSGNKTAWKKAKGCVAIANSAPCRHTSCALPRKARQPLETERENLKLGRVWRAEKR